MERELKFRGKRLENRKWVYGDLMLNYIAGSHICEIKTHIEIAVDKKTIGQYSGLKDKNGNEIYEGDIVKWAHDGLCYVVAFRRGMFFASVHELNEDVYGGYPLWMICEDNDLCEIIGDIYDNKITK